MFRRPVSSRRVGYRLTGPVPPHLWLCFRLKALHTLVGAQMIRMDCRRTRPYEPIFSPAMTSWKPDDQRGGLSTHPSCRRFPDLAHFHDCAPSQNAMSAFTTPHMIDDQGIGDDRSSAPAARVALEMVTNAVANDVTRRRR